MVPLLEPRACLTVGNEALVRHDHTAPEGRPWAPVDRVYV